MVQDDKISNKIWKFARFVPYFALSFEKKRGKGNVDNGG